MPFIAVIVLSLACGCASRRDKLPSARQRTAYDDASFAAGAGRPPTAATSYHFARILIGQGRDRDALYILSRIIRDHEKFVPAYNEMAGIYVRSDRVDDAINVLNLGLKQAPNDSVLHNNRGMCYFLNGDDARALEAFSQATERQPTNPTYRANRAAALAMLGRDDEAKSEYQGVLSEGATRSNLAVLARARQEQSLKDDAEKPAATQPAAVAQ